VVVGAVIGLGIGAVANQLVPLAPVVGPPPRPWRR